MTLFIFTTQKEGGSKLSRITLSKYSGDSKRRANFQTQLEALLLHYISILFKKGLFCLLFSFISQVGSEQLMQCREVIGELLGHQPSIGYTSRQRHSSSSAPLTKKRKTEHTSMDEEEEVYESIRHLYREESSFSKPVSNGIEKPPLRASCSLEMHQDTEESLSAGRIAHTLLVN